MNSKKNLKEKWNFVVSKLSEQFAGGENIGVDSIIYLIGIQELGKGYQAFKKDEKINLMHIAICKLLEPYGYYKFDYFDQQGWPHYKTINKLPNLKPGEQSVLIKEAVVNYFENIGFFS
ncbi:MAG: hypothetical protein ACK5H1_09565 [Tenacibaculum sp.]